MSLNLGNLSPNDIATLQGLVTWMQMSTSDDRSTPPSQYQQHPLLSSQQEQHPLLSSQQQQHLLPSSQLQVHSLPLSQQQQHPSQAYLSPVCSKAPSGLAPQIHALITHSYQSTRLSVTPSVPMGHPATQSSSAPSTQLFMGLNNLLAGMTLQTNQWCISHASTSLPRQPWLQRHVREPTIHPLSLRNNTPSIHNCMTNIPIEGGWVTEGVRVKIIIYPPQVCSWYSHHSFLSKIFGPQQDPSSVNELIAYIFLQESFNSAMQWNGCVHSFETAVNTPVSSLIVDVATAMRTGVFNYKLTSSTRDSLLVHGKALPLQLLEVVNHGRQHNDGQVYLRRTAHHNRTVWELMDNRFRFALPHLMIQGDVFIIYMSTLSIRFDFLPWWLCKYWFSLVGRCYRFMYTALIPPGSGPHGHSCISQKVYHQFAQDGPSNSKSTKSDDENNVIRPLLHSSRVRFKVTQPCAAYSSQGVSHPNTPTPGHPHHLHWLH